MHRVASLRFVPALFALVLLVSSAAAQKNDEAGATNFGDQSRKYRAYMGKFAQYGANGRAEAAYFRMINDRGGINGRRINFISLDSASDTAKVLPLARQLVEQNHVLLTVGIWGTPANLAVRSYLNEKKVPQLFVAAPDSVFDDPSHYPWTMGFQATKRTEGLNYARYILGVRPKAKIAILYAYDASGN